jgi:penicillin-binding protein 1B
MRIPVKVALYLMGIAFLGSGLYSAFLALELESAFSGHRWDLPSRVYSRPLLLYAGLALDREILIRRLQRLDYREVPAVKGPGEYARKRRGLDIYLHAFQYPDRQVNPAPFRIEWRGRRIQRIVRLDTRKTVDLLEIEPEVLMTFFGEMRREREVLPLQAFPTHLIQAVLAVEDRRFYDHPGLDIRGILRALWTNLREGRVVEGGSTITQQLIKNHFLNANRTLWRKAKEAWMALILERLRSKEEILEFYLNEIYMGQRGSIAIHGMGEASRLYFHKPVSRLSLEESALLAGLIRAPNLYAPHRHPTKALRRRNTVLRAMLDQGLISPEAYREARSRPLGVRPSIRAPSRSAPYFCDFLLQQLKDLYPPQVLQSHGLRIFTTLDPQIQQWAEEALERGLQQLERNHRHLRRKDPARRLQGCILVLQPQTGHILAMVGGRNYNQTQFNRVVQARRQPGSAFKPFVYLAALEDRTLSDFVLDAPIQIDLQGKPWAPRNADHRFRGRVTIRRALEESLNVPTVRLALEVGLPRILSVARSLGIESHMEPNPSLALGAGEVSPLELAAAYATLANEGIRPYLLSVESIMDPKGLLLERRHIELVRVVSPQVCYLVLSALKGVVTRGTARSLRAWRLPGEIAAKTGTSNGGRDAWFIGLTPGYLALVWVGFDQGDRVGLTGAQAALPIWADLMRRILQGSPSSTFLPPPGIVTAEIDPTSGGLATKRCPQRLREVYREGTQPSRPCPLHPPRQEDLLDRILGILEKIVR